MPAVAEGLSVFQQYGTQIIAVLGTVLGGVILAITNRLLDRTKQDRDEARNIREELRKDNDSLRAAVASMRVDMEKLEQANEARDIEIHRMRLENTMLMERLFKLHGLYYDATGQDFDTGFDLPGKK